MVSDSNKIEIFDENKESMELDPLVASLDLPGSPLSVCISAWGEYMGV